MNAMGFAWRSLVRQPARASLGVLGVAAVGALLFDMLLLSNGLVISMRGLLERTGFDLRVTATDALPGQGPLIQNAVAAAQTMATLPAVRSAIALRFANAMVLPPGPVGGSTTTRGLYTSFQGVAGPSTNAGRAEPDFLLREHGSREQMSRCYGAMFGARPDCSASLTPVPYLGRDSGAPSGNGRRPVFVQRATAPSRQSIPAFRWASEWSSTAATGCATGCA